MPGLLLRPHPLAPVASLGIAMIGAYQRWVSPRKGFACPLRIARGRRSCSSHARRLLRRNPRNVWRLRTLMRRRFARCRAARLDLLAMAEFQPGRRKTKKDGRGYWRRQWHECTDWRNWCNGCDCTGCDLDCSP